MDKNVISFTENEPTLRLCLRLPSGSKETIVMSVNHTIEVSYPRKKMKIILFVIFL